MSRHTPIVDLHCHPTLKPFGKFHGGPKRMQSLWYRDAADTYEKFLNRFAQLTRFTQADLTSLAKGNVRVAVVALYPLEKGFVKNKLGHGAAADLGLDLATGLGQGRIRRLQEMKSYFQDLLAEYGYLLAGSGKQKKHMVDGHGWYYEVVGSMAEADSLLLASPTAIAVVPTIEGAHVFDTGLAVEGLPDAADRKADILERVRLVKQWPKPPFFITFAHHFDNELCGHALAFDQGVQSKVLDQQKQLGEDFTPLGLEVLEALLGTTDGRRILIDSKHMSPRARRTYAARAERDGLPLIVSHGAVNGMAAYDEPAHRNMPTVGRFSSTGLEPTNGSRYPVSINFYDDELVAIARSQGLFGIQMDERRIGSSLWLSRAAGRVEPRKALYHSAAMIWNQIQHIAEVLDQRGLSAWDIPCIGSDFDGIVDPPNGYWAADDLNHLDDYLLMHAHTYLRERTNTLQQPFNKHIDPELLVEKVMHGNATAFLRRWFV